MIGTRKLGGCRRPITAGQPGNPKYSSRRCKVYSSSALSAADSRLASDGLIFSSGPSGSWDEAGVGSPVVRCFVGDNEERWYMWYSGRRKGAPAMDLIAPSSGSLGVAISRDGLQWHRSSEAVEGERHGVAAKLDVGAMLTPNQDWWTFDTAHLSVGDVQVLGNSAVNQGVGVYWCFYSGGNFEEIAIPDSMPGASSLIQAQASNSPGSPAVVEGLRTRPGLAMSQDGRNWARIEGDHYTGALFDVGEEGEWDELFIGHPQVLEMGPRERRMYYHSWDKRRSRFVVGMASSADGFIWKKKGVVYDPVEQGAQPNAHDGLGASSRQVVRDLDNRQFLMFYEAVAADGTKSIGLAASKDGISWKRCPHPVLQSASSSNGTNSPSNIREAGSSQEHSTGAWDGGEVGAPCPVSMSKGQWRLYYGGRAQRGTPGPLNGIGLALSDKNGPVFEGVPASYTRRKAAPII
ncbi:glycosyl hydrolase [Dunaliella salina]|uniref:Glycosyl hydrolase n=1 Tax=Dunaliella salina TaxID=3046 RepID=A0ABQ7H9J9_DUNSA|nr:glycosyl hydrolase [Dunaliella salina]|eukprot:KAF5843522.1 glycosyl hydrolase [Dunaliella salina]